MLNSVAAGSSMPVAQTAASSAVISVMPKNSLTVADDMHLVADGDVEPPGA